MCVEGLIFAVNRLKNGFLQISEITAAFAAERGIYEVRNCR
jgi:hypothetical protein